VAERFLERLTWPEVQEEPGDRVVAAVVPRIVQVWKDMARKE
jgi:hypothetical protein